MGGVHISDETFSLAQKMMKRPGVVQRDVAKALGIHESSISRIKKAKNYADYIGRERERKTAREKMPVLPADAAKQVQTAIEKQITKMIEKAGKDVLKLVAKKLYDFNARILGIEGHIRVLRTGSLSGKPGKNGTTKATVAATATSEKPVA